MEPRLYLCIDCGGSKTAAVVADSTGKVISRGYAGPSNHNDVGQAAFLEAVGKATDDALRRLYPDRTINLSDSSYFHAAWIGASGVDRPQDIVDLNPLISDLLHIPQGTRLIISNDTHLLASPVARFPGADTAAVVIAGTGSIVVAFRASQDGSLQELGRVGGWGWILGDEGSGFYVGRETIRWLLSTGDRESVLGAPDRPPNESAPKLQETIFKHFGISAPSDIFSVVYAAEPTAPSPNGDPSPRAHHLAMERKHRVASLTPLIFSAAFERHDPDALGILRRSAKALSDQIRAVMAAPSDNIHRSITPSKTVVCFGGSLVGDPGYRDLILEDLRNSGIEFLGAAFVPDAPASGAERLAKIFEV
ncbi:hypothetical protein FRB99_007969 [Tulasnella sp. 403]|nr:hypothetical protein FRB99_007969 [Tulasnella sp. 403]